MIRKKPVLLLVGFNALFVLITLGLVIPKLGGLTYPSIIHFDKWNGVDFLGNRADFLGVLLAGFAFIVMNVILAWRLFEKERFTAYFFLTANILIAILLLIFSATVIGNN